MIQVVGDLCPSIPAGATIRVQRRGMDWCCDSQGNTYALHEPTDEFITRVTCPLSASDCIYTGTNKEGKTCHSGKARNYSWRLPMNWTITIARSTTRG